ncbi:MAG: hypothetical protein Q8R30_05230 [bacterium]|nr:hypothetical protein [bacterium]MDZ4285525.1 hypothetical protein [Candidatus Sungbacteria bacterium]
MFNFFNKFQSRGTLFFIALICACQILVPLHLAHAAGLPVIDVAHIAETVYKTIKDGIYQAYNLAKNTITAIATNKLSYEYSLNEYLLKPLLRAAVFALVQASTNQIVSWIKNDGGSGVGFVKDFEGALVKEVDGRAGEFLNRLIGADLCSVNLRQFLKINLSTPDFNNVGAQFKCSLTGIVDNVDNFYKDFNNGGWPAFVAISNNPQNNFYGATMMAQLNLQAAKGSAAAAFQQKLQDSGGFLGVQLKKKSEVCEPPPEAGLDPVCYTKLISTTPGKLISESLDQSLNKAGFNFLNGEAGSIIDGAINQIMNAMVQRLIQTGTNLF